MKYPELYKAINETSPIPEKQWEQAEQFFTLKKFPKKSKLVDFGEASDRFFILVDGLVRLYYSNTKGQEFTKTFLGRSDIASSYAEMLQGIPSRTCMEALGDTLALELLQKDFLHLQSLHQCWKDLATKYTEKYFIFREQREYDLLTLSAKERYLKLKTQFPELIEKIPQHQVASYLGVTAVSLSRLLSEN